MSDNKKSDVSKSVTNSIADESPSLSSLSEKDKPWDKHRANTDKVERFYINSEFEEYVNRIHFCSEFLDFRLVPADGGELKLKLYSARFCRVRHCPVCQWRRSLMWKAKAYKVIPEIEKQYPKHRWLFLTLTIKNCPITELRETLDWMHQGFKRLTKLKVFPALGWLKSVEVTRGTRGDAHPHFHCLLLVPPSYFSHGYLSQKTWGELWQKCLRIDYKPVLDVQAIKPGQSPMSLIPELLKYCTKESDLVADREWFLELTRQMHKMRAIATGGVLRDYLRELEKEPEDLIGHDEENVEPDEGHLYFGWKRNLKKYKLID
jgi:Plasmid rolling circle replication initiator protein and truncated derivatives